MKIIGIVVALLCHKLCEGIAAESALFLDQLMKLRNRKLQARLPLYIPAVLQRTIVIVSVSLAAVICSSAPVLAETYYVTNYTDDGSSGTLRWCIEQANGGSNTTADVISFSPYAATITLNSALPSLHDPVGMIIEGRGDLNITIDGVDKSFVGFDCQSNNIRIASLKIKNFNVGVNILSKDNITVEHTEISFCDFGIQLGGSSGSSILNNSFTDITKWAVYCPNPTSCDISYNNFYLVDDPTWTQAAIWLLNGTDNRIDNNVIAGTDYGIKLESGANNNKMRYNRIGVDESGQALSDLTLNVGIYLGEGSYNNYVGFYMGINEYNVIAGCSVANIEIKDANNNHVMNNYIGTNIDGTVGLGGEIGVWVHESSLGTPVVGNTIGTSTARGNVIAAHVNAGVKLDYAEQCTVVGNWIGTDKTATINLGNGGNGIEIVVANSNEISNNVVVNNGERGIYLKSNGPGTVCDFNNIHNNTIHDNVGAGIVIRRVLAGLVTGNTLSQNILYDNGGLGIDLGNSDGVTVNDAGDYGLGPDLWLDHPDLLASGSTSLTGTTCANCTVELYRSGGDGITADPSGYGEGYLYVGTEIADGSGSVTFTGLTADYLHSAIAIDAAGNTSEFSANLEVINQPLLVTTTNSYGPGSLVEQINTANSMPGANVIEFASYVSGTIYLDESLPILNDQTGGTTIDGCSAAGGSHSIILDGGNIADYGIRIFGSDDNEICGLTIINCGTGIYVNSGSNNRINDNHIGISQFGTVEYPNSVGIRVMYGYRNEIGLTTGNLISGNNNEGIICQQSGNLIIANNIIGTDEDGDFAIANEHGIVLSACVGVLVADNLISGNESSGLTINDGSNCTIVRNKIGTNASGSVGIQNNWYGIGVFDLASNRITGLLIGDLWDGSGDGNVISGNGIGILMRYGEIDCLVGSNLIGVGVNGYTPIPNGTGIKIEDINEATIGIPTPGLVNTISHNGHYGIDIVNSTASVFGNILEDNGFEQKPFGSEAAIYIHRSPNCEVRGNRIVNNRRGVIINGAASVGNKIIINELFGNGRGNDPDLDVSPPGITECDEWGGDSPSGQICYPKTDLRPDGATVCVRGTGPPNSDIYVYLANNEPNGENGVFNDLSGYSHGGAVADAGGSILVAQGTIDEYGNINPDICGIQVDLGDVLTANCTSSLGTTSEFGPNMEVNYQFFQALTGGGTSHGKSTNAASPVALRITDPYGNIIDATTNQIPGASYDALTDIDGDGTPDHQVSFFGIVSGDYDIQVIPEPSALPGDTYKLIRVADGETTIMANEAPVPEQGQSDDFVFTPNMGGGCCGAFTSGYTGNTNCDASGLRNLADITRLIDNVYISKETLCCEENGNINGDAGGLLNLADITKLIDHVYISKDETATCQ